MFHVPCATAGVGTALFSPKTFFVHGASPPLSRSTVHWHDGVYHTITPPLGRFSMVDISTVGIVPVPRRWALETSRRELSGDVSFGIGTLLVVEQSSLKNCPRGVSSSSYTGNYQLVVRSNCCRPRDTRYSCVYMIPGIPVCT